MSTTNDGPGLPRDVADVYSEEGYYAVIPEWVLDADVSAQAIRLYAVLRRYADQRTMHANPSRKTLAGRLKAKDEKVVDRAVDDLQRIGALSVIPRWRNEDGHIAYAPDATHRERTSNGYQLHRVPKVIHPVEGIGGGAKAPTPRPESPHPGGADAPTVGAQKGEKPQPCDPQPLEPQTPHPSGGAPADEGDAQLSLVDAPAEPDQKPGRRKTLLPEGWEPSPELAAWTREFAPGFPRSELEQFRDWAKGDRVLKADWDATWRNSVRRWKERTSRTRGPGRPRAYTDDGWKDGTSAASWDRLKQTGGQDR